MYNFKSKDIILNSIYDLIKQLIIIFIFSLMLQAGLNIWACILIVFLIIIIRNFVSVKISNRKYELARELIMNDDNEEMKKLFTDTEEMMKKLDEKIEELEDGK